MGVRNWLSVVALATAFLVGSATPRARDIDQAGDSRAVASAQSEGWPQWGGPSRDFVVSSGALAEAWPESGPPVVWSRPLGTGHSSIVVDDGRLYTMYRAGNGRARQGPWNAEETVIALDAASGKTLWEHRYPSRREDFGFGAGPHSTPLVVGERLFTAGTNKQLFAFDKRSGKVLWSHDLIKAFGAPELLLRPVVKAGYGCSPLAFRDTIICSVGGPGQAVMAFRQDTGAVVWKSGDFLTSESAPILIEFAGRQHLVLLAGGTITGMDPATGEVLWSHPHDPGNDLNCVMPLWDGSSVLFVSSAYKAGSRAIRLRQEGAVTRTEELWFTNRVRFMFLSAVRLGDFVYGTTGDFGPAFLTALDLKTGQARWQHRGFGRASLVHADGKVIIMDEDGDLALARVTPEAITMLSQARIFETTTWTAPSLVGTTLYARDREQIVALDLSARGDATTAAANAAPAPPRGAPTAAAAPAGRPTTPPAALHGTWKLDVAQSAIDTAAGLAGLIGAGAPPLLHITQPANGAVVVESSNNEGHVRIYDPAAPTSTPVGQGGTITMRTAWSGGTLTGEGRAQAASGASTAVRESYQVSRDRRTLTIDVAVTGAEERRSRLVYTRIDSVGPCETWPTPCKR